MKILKIEMPKKFMNTGIGTDKESGINYFIADTNDSSNWDTLKFPLPEGKWDIHSIDGKQVTLIEKK